MKKNAYIAVFALLLLIVFTACSKTTNGRWVIYYETGCKEPWMSKSDYATRSNLEDMLKGEGIIPLKIKIKGNNSIDCTTCDCFTGREIWLQVDKSQVSFTYWFGFISK